MNKQDFEEFEKIIKNIDYVRCLDREDLEFIENEDGEQYISLDELDRAVRYCCEKIWDMALNYEKEKNKILVEALEFYADPENNKEEWVSDMSYYDPSPPLRRTVLQHGKKARESLAKYKG